MDLQLLKRLRMTKLNDGKIIDGLLNNSKMEIDKEDSGCQCFYAGGKCIHCGSPDPVWSESLKE